MSVTSADRTFLTSALGNSHKLVATELKYPALVASPVAAMKGMTVAVDGGTPIIVGADHERGEVTIAYGGEKATIVARTRPRVTRVLEHGDYTCYNAANELVPCNGSGDEDDGNIFDLKDDLEDLIPGRYSTWSDLKHFVEELFDIDLDDVMNDLSSLDIDIDLRKGWNAAGGDGGIGDYFEVYIHTTNDGDEYSLTVSDDYDDWVFTTGFVYNAHTLTGETSEAKRAVPRRMGDRRS